MPSSYSQRATSPGSRQKSPTASVSRSSRMRVGGRSRLNREEAARRAQELKQDVETTVHVLDGGVNRTPVPLQHRHSLLGLRGGHRRESQAMSEMNSSIFQSSFLASMDGRWGGSKMTIGGGDSGLSNYLQSSTSGRRNHRGRKESGVSADGGNIESSTQSLFMPGNSTSESLPLREPSSVQSESMTGGGSKTHRPVGGVQWDPWVDGQNILDGAICRKPKPMTDTERRAWLRSKTLVRLTETPTIHLYCRQDEAVSNDFMHIVNDVADDNALYAEVVEAHRVDEGTRYQERGTATCAPAKRSIHSEVRPPGKVDAGALQVTPWMLKDELAPPAEEGDDEAEAEATAAGGDGAAGGGGNADGTGGEGGEDEDDLVGGDLDDDMNESGTNDNGSNSGRLESASAEQSAGQSTTATGGGAGGRGGTKQWMLADSLMSNLRVMERAVVQNMMEGIQLAYRGISMNAEAGRLGVTQAPKPPAPPAVAPGTDTDNNGTNIAAEGGPLSDTANQTATKNGTVGGASSSAGGPLAAGSLTPMTMSEGIRALWCYRCPQTRGRPVTCMAWNRREVDILAVGYGPCRANLAQDAADEHENADGKSPAPAANGASGKGKTPDSMRGMVCCWSLKNPLAPELLLHLQNDAGVSSLAFSFEHPSLLAVGDTEGGIVVYDIQKDLALPSIVPAVSAGLHTGAVWDLKWVSSGKERDEFLMSISADGRVVQWAVGKTVEKMAPDLLHLKRQPGAQVESAFVEGVAAAEEAAAAAAAARRGKGKSHAGATAGVPAGGGGGSKEDVVLSRQAGGMCFDVCPADHAIYVVGTEEGSVYQCNKSQTESYDLDYLPHAELVYRIRWSPYSARFFLTCSADWTTRLYALGQAQPIAQFESPNQDAVQDVAWSSSNAILFATATAQGSVELWAVGDTVFPRATVRYNDHRRLNCLLFAEQETPVVVVGDDDGDVTVFLLKSSIYRRQDLCDDEQEAWLEDAVKNGS